MGSRGNRFTTSYHRLLLVFALLLGAFLTARALDCPQYSWLAWGGILPLLLAIKSLPPVKALVAGALWGLAIMSCALAVPDFRARIPSTASSIALLAAVPALYAYGGAILRRRVGFNSLIVALGWIGVELAVRPLGLPNGLLAGAKGDSSLMHLIGNVLGYGFVAFLVVFVDALIITVVCSIPRLLFIRSEIISQIHHYSYSSPSRKQSLLETYVLRPSRPRAPPAG
jgi:apolipoprotein N-acyltransferase